MATVSFDKNIVIREPEAIEKLIDVLENEEVKSVDTSIASDNTMAKGEELLRRYFSRFKNS